MVEPATRFEEIYEAYSGLILAYAARRTGDVSDAADVVAETFTVAWRRIDDVPPGEIARPWLYGVARRVLANHRRSSERRQRLGDRLQSELSGAAAAPQAADHDDLARIAGAFAQLGPGDRELLTLVAWDGLSREEIATMLGSKPATVRVRIHRARKRLAQNLEKFDVKRARAAGHEAFGEVSTLSTCEET